MAAPGAVGVKAGPAQPWGWAASLTASSAPSTSSAPRTGTSTAWSKVTAPSTGTAASTAPAHLPAHTLWPGTAMWCVCAALCPTVPTAPQAELWPRPAGRRPGGDPGAGVALLARTDPRRGARGQGQAAVCAGTQLPPCWRTSPRDQLTQGHHACSVLGVLSPQPSLWCGCAVPTCATPLTPAACTHFSPCVLSPVVPRLTPTPPGTPAVPAAGLGVWVRIGVCGVAGAGGSWQRGTGPRISLGPQGHICSLARAGPHSSISRCIINAWAAAGASLASTKLRGRAGRCF